MPVTTAIIGAGQAGLAMSRCLTERSIDHVILERGDTANAWRTERWDSLRLLTPNWLSRLPGYSYDGPDPHGYMSGAEVRSHLDDYRRSFDAPVQEQTTVQTVKPTSGGFDIQTNRGTIRCRTVVIATGACGNPFTPELADSFPRSVQQIAPIHYRNSQELAAGRVLVVGASASGAQIADELALAGREVTLAVGNHVRLPRRYRGRDIHWWLDAVGILGERWDQVEDITKARRAPSLQLVGSSDCRDLDLNSLAANGVQLVGRLGGVAGPTAQFSGSLANTIASADLKLRRLLNQIDDYATISGLDDGMADHMRPLPTKAPTPCLSADLQTFGAVVWATGFRPSYPWLPAGLLDRKGRIVHDGGVMTQPGMYVLGLPFTRTRKSPFLDGVGGDASALACHLGGYLSTIAARSH